MASNKEMLACISRVAEAFSCTNDDVSIEFSTRFGWGVRVETPSLDRRSTNGRKKKTLPDVSNGNGDTLAEAEANVMKRVRFHRVEEVLAAQLEELRRMRDRG